MDQHILNYSSGLGAADFSFAFNNSDFSDRMLQIEVVPDSITDCKSSHAGSSMMMDRSNIGVRVKSLHVNTAILAEKSAIFRKLFSNGMRETKERNITVRINCSDEMAFTDLFQYMYSVTLRARSTKELLDLLMVADKFQVTSCVDWCSSALHNLPMSTETAFLYIDLPKPSLTNGSVQSLVDTGNKFLLEQFGDIEKFAEDLINLPLEAIEAMFSSDELQVESEDALFDFVIKWARKLYTDVEERREIWSNRLCQLIRFPNKSHHKLYDISCYDLDGVCTLKAVSEALHFKAQELHYRSNERNYKHLPITVVESDTPIRECTVFS